MSHVMCPVALFFFNQMTSFVNTGSFMNRATLSYVTAGHFTKRHKTLTNKTSKPNKTSVLDFNIKIIRYFITKTIIIWSSVHLKSTADHAETRGKGWNQFPRDQGGLTQSLPAWGGPVHPKTPRNKEQVTPQGTGWAGTWAGTATTPSSTLTPGTSRCCPGHSWVYAHCTCPYILELTLS